MTFDSDLEKLDLEKFELGTGAYSKGYELARLKNDVSLAKKMFELFKKKL